ncbi:MAG: aldehyde dehydrogenase family protein [Planctomycetes bacterium]|nr:aldehyde dehydrogenase family protein [Planctomycetota bacterium]
MSNLVDGEIRNSEPATGRPSASVPITTPSQVREAVERARKAQAAWAKLSWAERRRRLLRFRDVLNDRTDEVVDLISRETGKPRFEALTHEVIPLLDLTHYFATRAQRLLRDEPIRHHLLWPLKKGYLRFEPRGVVAVVSPWNFPFAIPMGDVITSLAARNAVVVKPSEWTPHTMLKARELVLEAGIDPDLVAVIPGGAETGAALVEATVNLVLFTGSVATGRKVGAACGARLIPFVAELGGKDAAIVLPDVDVLRAARQVVHGAFFNCGQACSSIERVLVHESIYEPFVSHVVQITGSLRQGVPLSSASECIDLGAMVVPAQLEIVRRHVQDARAKGARILTGGSVPRATSGRFFEPTVLIDVTEEMLCWREETFGPLLPIRTFREIDEAVRIANDSPYGLNAYVFSRDRFGAERLANRLEAGGVIVNDFSYQHGTPEVPWGGWKNSGIGRVHGDLRSLSEIRYVGLPRFNWTLPVAFPYTDAKYRFFHRWGRRAFRGLVSRFL